jgi:radical SAM-linked protein
MRTIQKVVRRAKLPVQYSKGFNPHMALSIAQPLSVGVYSDGEYMDLILVEEVPEDEIIERLNEKTASGIKFKAAKRIVEVENEKKLPQGMALIDACRYIVKIKYDSMELLEEEMENLLKEKEWNTIKKSKKGEREVDIKALVYEIKYWIKDNDLVLNMLIRSGSREHLSADLLVSYIQERTSNASIDTFVDTKREEMYFLKNDKLMPLYNCR